MLPCSELKQNGRKRGGEEKKWPGEESPVTHPKPHISSLNPQTTGKEDKKASTALWVLSLVTSHFFALSPPTNLVLTFFFFCSCDLQHPVSRNPLSAVKGDLSFNDFHVSMSVNSISVPHSCWSLVIFSTVYFSAGAGSSLTISESPGSVMDKVETRKYLPQAVPKSMLFPA